MPRERHDDSDEYDTWTESVGSVPHKAAKREQPTELATTDPTA